MDESKLDRIILALLFAADEPLSPRRLSAVIDDVSAADIGASVDRLSGLIRSEMPSIVLERVAGGWQLSTNVEYAEYISRLYSGRRKQRLSKAALETVAIIAYKQPVTRADIESVRGVGCGGVITTLMERSLIKIVGKAKVLGAPFLYGTTQEFLEYLGINSLKDLPSIEELEALLEEEERTGTGRQAEQGASEGSAEVESASVDSFVGPTTTEDADRAHEETNTDDIEPPPSDRQAEENPDKVQLDG